MCGNLSAQQADCKVNLPAISGSYTGECKKGLANGVGVARGVDSYKGEFFKGMPQGKGVYTWANGNYYDGEWKNGKRDGSGKFVAGDSVKTGFWKADVYQGVRQGPAYKINLNRSVARYGFIKTVEPGNGVKIKIMLGGSDNSDIEDFSLAYSSGTEYRVGPVYGLQNVSLPLDVTVKYRTWNQIHSTQYDVVFEFIIFDPGTWSVVLTNM